MPTDTTPKPPFGLAIGPGDKADQKSDVKKIDPFHPDMPTIPGVSDAALPSTTPFPTPSPAGGSRVNRRLYVQAGGIIAAIVLVASGILWRVKRSTPASTEPATTESQASNATQVDLPPLISAGTPDEGRNVVAMVSELSKPWASKKFTFVKPVTNEAVDALAIRLPGGGWWAFALQEPYGRCTLDFLTDLGQISREYGYRASHPMAVNPCSRTVYDPLKLGPLGGNTWGRGEIVQGGGLRPPISIEVKVRDHSIIADAIE